MFSRHRISIALLASLQCATGAFAQSTDSSLAFEHPDFGGAWVSSFVTPLERMPDQASLVVNTVDAIRVGEELYLRLASRGHSLDPDILAGNVRILLRIGDSYRTSIVSDPPDGRIPYTPHGKSVIEAARVRVPQPPDGPEFRPNSERCIAGHGQSPLTLTPTINARQIVQTDEFLMIYTEDGPDVRIIPIAPSDAPAGPVQWGGRSSAHWRSDQLIVETAGARPGVRGGVQGTFVLSEDARITEQFSLLSPNEILYRYTVEDPVMYTRPWSGEFVLFRDSTAASEYACHEGNYGTINMLEAGRRVVLD